MTHIPFRSFIHPTDSFITSNSPSSSFLTISKFLKLSILNLRQVIHWNSFLWSPICFVKKAHLLWYYCLVIDNLTGGIAKRIRK